MPVSARSLAVVCPILLPMGLLLTGCNGFGVFLDDTHGPSYRVNAPLANSELSRRIEGRPVAIEAMRAQPGNVWPGPVPPQATLEDLQKEPPGALPDLEGSTPPPQSNVPGLVIPQIPHHLQPRPGEEAGALNGPIGSGVPTQFPRGPLPPTGAQLPIGSEPASPQGTISSTPQGPAVSTRNPSGLGQANPSDTKLGITVPNGDGTSTVIAPDGSITTIKTPK